MVSLSCVSLLALFAMASSAPADKPYYDIKDAPALFEKFIKDYDRQYKDEADRAAHYEAFVKSLGTINKANSGSNSATFDINKFADYTPSERQSMFGLGVREQKEK